MHVLYPGGAGFGVDDTYKLYDTSVHVQASPAEEVYTIWPTPSSTASITRQFKEKGRRIRATGI